MSYNIKPYSEDFVESQAKLGQEISTEWKGYTQSDANALKQAYSSEDFDPTTRFYAFDGDQLVGFVTSRIIEEEEGKKGDLRLPLCKQGYEDVGKQLLNKVIETMQSREVKKITTIVKNDWGNLMELAEEFGFEHESDGNSFAVQDVDDLTVPQVKEEIAVKEVDIERDGEQLLEIFTQAFGMSEEQAKNNLDAISNIDDEQLISHAIIYEDDKIVGRSLAYTLGEDEAAMGNIYDSSDDYRYFDALFAHIVKKCKENGILKITKFKIGTEANINRFEKYGLEFNHVIKNYVKQI